MLEEALNYRKKTHVQLIQDNAHKWQIRQTCASADELVHQPKVEIQDLMQCQNSGSRIPWILC